MNHRASQVLLPLSLFVCLSSSSDALAWEIQEDVTYDIYDLDRTVDSLSITHHGIVNDECPFGTSVWLHLQGNEPAKTVHFTSPDLYVGDGGLDSYQYVAQVVLSSEQSSPLAGLTYRARGLSHTVYQRAGSSNDGEALLDEVWRKIVAPATYYIEIEPGEGTPIVTGYSGTLSLFSVNDPLTITGDMHLAFGEIVPELENTASLIMGQSSLLVVRADSSPMLHVASGARVVFTQGSGIVVLPAADSETMMSLAAMARTNTLESSEPSEEVLLLTWDEGALIEGIENATVVYPQDDYFYFGHLERRGNQLYGTPRLWVAQGPYKDVAFALYRAGHDALASGALHSLANLIPTPDMAVSGISNAALKGRSLGTSSAMREWLDFNGTELLGVLGEILPIAEPLTPQEETGTQPESARQMLALEDDESGSKEKSDGWHLPSIPKLNFPVTVRLIGERTRDMGYHTNAVTIQEERADIRRETTGIEIGLDRRLRDGAWRWGLRLAYRSARVSSHDNEPALSWRGQSDGIAARGYVALGNEEDHAWWVVSAGYARADDTLRMPWASSLVSIDDLSRTAWQIGLTRLMASGDKTSGLRFWGSFGGALLGERGASWHVRLDGEDIFRVKEKDTVLARLEAGAGTQLRADIKPLSLNVRAAAGLKAALYAGPRSSRFSVETGDAVAHDSVRDLPRASIRAVTELMLSSKYGVAALTAGALTDDRHRHGLEAGLTVLMRF